MKFLSVLENSDTGMEKVVSFETATIYQAISKVKEIVLDHEEGTFDLATLFEVGLVFNVPLDQGSGPFDPVGSSLDPMFSE